MKKPLNGWTRLSLLAAVLVLSGWVGAGHAAHAGCTSRMATLNILGDWCGGAAGDCMIVSCPRI